MKQVWMRAIFIADILFVFFDCSSTICCCCCCCCYPHAAYQWQSKYTMYLNIYTTNMYMYNMCVCVFVVLCKCKISIRDFSHPSIHWASNLINANFSLAHNAHIKYYLSACKDSHVHMYVYSIRRLHTNAVKLNSWPTYNKYACIHMCIGCSCACGFVAQLSFVFLQVKYDEFDNLMHIIIENSINYYESYANRCIFEHLCTSVVLPPCEL